MSDSGGSIPKKTMLRSTGRQISLLVNYMSSNRDFANGVGAYAGALGSAKTNDEWETLRALLNEHGADKSVQQWKHTWRDLKRQARKVMMNTKVPIPIMSDTTFKIIETISDSNSYMETVTEMLPTVEAITMEDWEDGSEHSMHDSNETEGNKNCRDDSSISDKSTVEEKHAIECMEEFVVSNSEANEDFIDRSCLKPQSDPLKASVVGTPRLSRRPSPTTRPYHHSPANHRHTTAVKHRHSLITRKRKAELYKNMCNHFVKLEQRRLKMEEERDIRLHEREMERLKLELQRIDVHRNNNEMLHQLVIIAQKVFELLQSKSS